jgi:putative membrane protein
MLWIKAFHLIFVVCWFAGIFYLPRLFVYHAQSNDQATREQFKIMERRLYRFMTPFMWISVGLGIWMTAANWAFFKTQIWLHIKVTLVLLLMIYHLYCGRIVKAFAEDRNVRGHIYYRWFNELPVFLLFPIVILVIVRPFT